MKYFIVADVHGYYDELINILKQAGFDKDNPNHTFVSLGNMLDRGYGVKECLEFINSLNPDRCILIQGNHEVNMIAAFQRGGFIDGDISNGVITTIQSLTGLTDEQEGFKQLKDSELLNQYLDQLQPYYETFYAVFIHGWIPCYYIRRLYSDTEMFYLYEPRWRDASDDDFCYATWLNGMEAWNRGVREYDKTIICGNFPAAWGNYNLHKEGGEFKLDGTCNCPACVAQRQQLNGFITLEDSVPSDSPQYTPFRDDGIVNIEGGIAFGGVLNCLTWEDDPLETMPIKKPKPVTPKKITFKGIMKKANG